MIHDVTIPFSFDTTPIENQIANIGAQEVKSIIREVTLNGIYSALPSKRNGYYNSLTPTKDSDINWKSYVDDRMYKWLDAHRQEIVDEATYDVIDRNGADWPKIKNAIRDELGEFLWKRTKRNPMILPILMDAEV